MKKVNIAIDGPSGVGKSTIGKELATNLDFFFVNTGSLYRAIAYDVLNNKINVYQTQDVVKHAQKNHYSFNVEGEVFVNDIKITDKLRSDEVSMAASIVASYALIREQVVKILQKFSKNNKGIIMDGRDTTFVIMPDAEVKIFLWASPEVRAIRRMEQNKILGYEQNFNVVLEEIKTRDYQDMNREIHPLHKTEDAHLIDSTNMTKNEVFQEILTIIKMKAV